jgi:hypothetical protein
MPLATSCTEASAQCAVVTHKRAILGGGGRSIRLVPGASSPNLQRAFCTLQVAFILEFTYKTLFARNFSAIQCATLAAGDGPILEASILFAASGSTSDSRNMVYGEKHLPYVRGTAVRMRLTPVHYCPCMAVFNPQNIDVLAARLRLPCGSRFLIRDELGHVNFIDGAPEQCLPANPS